MDLRYPIGKYEPKPYSEKQKTDWINDIRILPQLLENALLNLDEAQQNTAYREGGWTIKQVVHHVADSHLNAFCRFKLGLTEDKPVIKPYDEKQWAMLADTDKLPTNVSITLLHALHTRWQVLLESIHGEQWDRIVFHPAANKEMTLWFLLGNYAWHGRHHLGHIRSLRDRMGW